MSILFSLLQLFDSAGMLLLELLMLLLELRQLLGQVHFARTKTCHVVCKRGDLCSLQTGEPSVAVTTL